MDPNRQPDERTKRRIRWTVAVLLAVVVVVYVGTMIDQLAQ